MNERAPKALAEILLCLEKLEYEPTTDVCAAMMTGITYTLERSVHDGEFTHQQALIKAANIGRGLPRTLGAIMDRRPPLLFNHAETSVMLGVASGFWAFAGVALGAWLL